MLDSLICMSLLTHLSVRRTFTLWQLPQVPPLDMYTIGFDLERNAKQTLCRDWWWRFRVEIVKKRRCICGMIDGTILF